MTRDEAKKLLQITAALYPNWRPDDLGMAVDAWAEVLSDQNWEVMARALKEFARTDTSGFAPSPGKLIEIGDGITRKMYWGRVTQAITLKDYTALPGGTE